MDIAQLITGALMLASAGMVGYLLKDVPVKIYQWGRKKMMYSVSVYQNDELFDVLEDYLFANYNQHYKDVEASLGQSDYPKPSTSDQPNKVLKYKQEESFFIAKISGKNVFISKSKEKLDKAVSLRDIWYRKYVIRGFMAKKEINALLLSIVDDYNKSLKKGVLKVYTNNTWGEWLPLQDISVKSLSKIVLDPAVKNNLVSDIDSFMSSFDWYYERGIRHKRGYLFYGPPGNGKTSLAMAIAEHLNRDVYVMNLNAFDSDGNLIRAFSSLGKNIVLLIEDIDRSFSKRENVDSKVSFSTVLNQFDGALCRDGIISVITTNHIEKLDEALIRDGRMDFKLEIPNPSNELVKEYIENFYSIKISTEIESNGMSMSSVQEYCIRRKDNPLAAINHFSKQKTA